MIGLLDPAFLLPRSGPEGEQELVRELDLVARMCQLHGIVVPPFEEYWPHLWSTLGRSLEQSLGRPDAKSAVRQIRRLGEVSGGLILTGNGKAATGQAWRRGFSALFGWGPLKGDWEQRMAEAAVHAATIANDRVVLLVRRVVNRNITEHSACNTAGQTTTLQENTRWVLHIQPTVLGHRRISCIHHPRNLTQPWTSRFDWRLPVVADGARYPFCPPDRWWNASTQAVRTVSATPAWLDCVQNGWARPHIGGGAGYHWDVYIQVPTWSQAIGVNQVNVVEFGGPRAEGTPGTLHHVPSNKAARVNDCGWSCP